jgi:malate dehydrogenase (oxaloacetate-decarboxylating)(NADP+)
MNTQPQNKWLKLLYLPARVVRLFGFEPKVAFVSHSTFGQPLTSRTKHIRRAVEILKEKKVDFEFDGDMQPDVALDSEYEAALSLFQK